MNKISVVIPVYGQWPLVKMNVERCLALDGDYINEIIVVDDFSPEQSPYSFDRRVLIIRNISNLGYSGSVNVGLKAATTPIIVLLDSDAYPTKPYVRFLNSIYADSSIGCIG